jgi:RNA polymerase sigma factor (sigma-70 family)
MHKLSGPFPRAREKAMREDASRDVPLVQAARAGSRQAFGELVERYKRLICSLAYGFTGSAALSEDIAQEAFIKAWEELDQLREPARFRSWICAITRRLCGVADQKEVRFVYPVSVEIPAFGADIPSMDPSPLDRMITREEVSLAWRALARVPQIYRLPLVLFYREDQSVEKGAKALGLTEETAKKRLYRGRQMLQERALAIVVSALARTRISTEFTARVIAAISVSAGATTADASMRTGVRSSSGAKAVVFGAAATIPDATGAIGRLAAATKDGGRALRGGRHRQRPGVRHAVYPRSGFRGWRPAAGLPFRSGHNLPAPGRQPAVYPGQRPRKP